MIPSSLAFIIMNGVSGLQFNGVRCFLEGFFSFSDFPPLFPRFGQAKQWIARKEYRAGWAWSRSLFFSSSFPSCRSFCSSCGGKKVVLRAWQAIPSVYGSQPVSQ